MSRSPDHVSPRATRCSHARRPALALWFLAARAARAGDLYVATTGSDANDCRSPAAACASVQSAIGRAAPGDAVHVAAGRYVENPVIDAAGADVRILGEDRATTLLDGSTGSAVVTVAAGASVALSGLTVTNGSNPSDGGGVVNRGTLALSDCAVEGNRGFNAGGILNDGGSLTLSRSTVRNNEATGGGGGGIINDGTLDVFDSTLEGNRAFNAGALLALGGTARLTNCTLSGNTTTGSSGAAFVNFGAALVLADRPHHRQARRKGCARRPSRPSAGCPSRNRRSQPS